MKNYLLIASLLLLSFCLKAQSQITLPPYKAGTYYFDNIYSYGGDINTKGNISVSSEVQSKFVTGITFYMVVDSFPMGGHRDSAGVGLPLKKGQLLPLPVSFFAPKIWLRVVAAGTPVNKGETYLCNLTFAFTTGEDWSATLIPSSLKTCVVDQAQAINPVDAESSLQLYPNPAADYVSVKALSKNETYIIYDALGKFVQSGMLSAISSEIAIQSLIPGNYVIQIGSEQQTLKFVKK